MFKTCSECNIQKSLDNFKNLTRSKDGKYPSCKSCCSKKGKSYYNNNKEKVKERAISYYEVNKEKILNNKQKKSEQLKEYNKLYKQQHREDVKKYNKLYKQQHREEISEWKKKYREENKEILNNSRRLWIEKNPIVKLAISCRKRLREYLDLKGFKKLYKFSEYIGCSPEELKIYIESKFKDGMAWDNYGRWHLDHIIPLASAETVEDLYKLNYYTNLQPLWGFENIKKSNITYLKELDEIKNFLNQLNISINKIDLETEGFCIYTPFTSILYIEPSLLVLDNDKLKRDYLKNKNNKIGRCFIIYSFEWQNRKEKVKSFLRSSLNTNIIRLNARDLEIKEISKKETSEFLNKYHMLGSGQIEHSFGYYYNEELVSLATLAFHHRKGKELVLNRYIVKEGVTVRGGLSKLTKFIRERFGNIVTWIDLRHSNGENWFKCGWSLEEALPPDYSYFDPINNVIIAKQKRRRKVVNTPENLSESQHAKLDGLIRLYDCGKLRLRIF